MKLREWLDQRKMTQAAFAARIGVTPPTISKFIAGTILPDLNTIIAIERETADDVRATDFQRAAE